MNLAALELKYSGGPTRVKRRKASPDDPRLNGRAIEDLPGAMLSGGRFTPSMGYAEVYEKHLGNPKVIVELGTLLGVGLAIWCDLFPDTRVIGLDVDPDRVDFDGLRARGAFRHNEPEVYFMDELAPDAGVRFAQILGNDEVDVFIDDALHDDASILTAMGWALPYVTGKYFVEDNNTVAPLIERKFGLSVQQFGGLTLC